MSAVWGWLSVSSFIARAVSSCPDRRLRRPLQLTGVGELTAASNLKAKGISVIYISHRIDEIFALANRVTVLKDGKLVDTLNVKDTKKSDLIQMMVGRSRANISKAKDVALRMKS
jgi:ABC-type uncharacterized transport system ATPase subunit